MTTGSVRSTGDVAVEGDVQCGGGRNGNCNGMAVGVSTDGDSTIHLWWRVVYICLVHILVLDIWTVSSSKLSNNGSELFVLGGGGEGDSQRDNGGCL